MSDTNEWVNWIENAISSNHIKHYEYEHFNHIQEIGVGGFGKIYRAKWRSLEQFFVLKSLLNLNGSGVRELVNELELQRNVTFHENIISFHGITTTFDKGDNTKRYLLVMEYADGGSLRKYLKENNNDDDFTWENRCKLAYQLASAVSCLHDEGIVHRDLHSNNVLVHQGTIKLADFGLSKKVDEASIMQKDIFGVVPYIDPKKFAARASYSLNRKSDVYSIGVLLWEISKGQPPFYVEGGSYDASLAVEILQGVRETPVPGTPSNYVKLYTECWDGEPDKRPTIHEVVERLKLMIPQKTSGHQIESFDASKNMTMNSAENFASHGGLSQVIKNFGGLSIDSTSASTSNPVISQSVSGLNLDMKEFESVTSTPLNDLSAEVDKITEFILEITNRLNEVNEKALRKQHTLSYFNDHNINSKDVYEWLTYNYNNNFNATFLLGYFNYYGIVTDENHDKSFNLFLRASKQDHMLSQYFVGKCYQNGYGTTKNEKLAFKYFEKLANDNHAIGQLEVGYCYNLGSGVEENPTKSIHWYEKASDNGNLVATYKLGQKYINGMGVEKDYKKAFELFKKSANEGYIDGMIMLGVCHSNGIGTNVDWKSALESYQLAANLGSMIAQYNLGNMYKNGEGTEKNVEEAIRWFKKSAEQGYTNAKKQLDKLEKLAKK